MAKERVSNIELFRIVATFMIIIVHCNGWFLRMNGVDSWYDGGIFYAITRTFIQSATCIGVDCFILISGYFSIKPKFSSLVNLFSLLFYFYVGCYLVSSYIGDSFSWSELFREAMAFSRENWFIQCYLLLMLFSPIINCFVETVNSKTLLRYIVLFAFCAFYFGCVIDSKDFYFNKGYSTTNFVLIYLIGRYIRLYGEKTLQIYSATKIFLFWFLVTVLMSVIRLLELENEELYLSYCSPLQIISSSLLFITFLRFHFSSKVINYIATSCLAVFIIHVSNPVFTFLLQHDYYWYVKDIMILWIAKTAFLCIIIFASAIFLDKIRIFLFKPIIKLINKKCKNTAM